jgi:hypothetical protein
MASGRTVFNLKTNSSIYENSLFSLTFTLRVKEISTKEI